MGTNVTVKSYCPLREKEILDRLYKSMVDVKALVQRQAMANLNQIPPSHPQRQTGRLISNVAEFSHIEKEGNTITAVIGTKIPYGFYLELGTVKMPPYSWLFPAVEMKRQEIIETIKSGGGRLVDIEVSGGISEK